MRIGILGGTFDPIHMGHLVAASEVHSALDLDTVVFIPAGDPWQKADRDITDAQHRLAMVELAIADDARFSASDTEIVRQGATYSLDTVLEWKAANPEDDLFWIVGADALVRISTWHRWEEFVASVTIVCVNRADIEVLSIDVPFEFESVAMPQVRISATELRTRFASGVNSKYLVPEAAIDYINQHGLYA
jgi:nicotinate-nucleotide adenylyltransferase